MASGRVCTSSGRGVLVGASCVQGVAGGAKEGVGHGEFGVFPEGSEWEAFEKKSKTENSSF